MLQSRYQVVLSTPGFSNEATLDRLWKSIKGDAARAFRIAAIRVFAAFSLELKIRAR